MNNTYYIDENEQIKELFKKIIENNIIDLDPLLPYSSTIQRENKFVNRDLNAAINILHCLVLPERPSILNRSNCQGRLENIIVREIKC